MKGTMLVLLAALVGGAACATAQQPRADVKPPPTVTALTYPPQQVLAGRTVFAAHCGFCHGRDTAGGETGPDLTRSTLVAEDVRGDKIGPLLRTGRPDRGMPASTLSGADLAALVAYIHDQKSRAESQEGGRRTVSAADLDTGDAAAGQRYFEGAGGCTNCHSVSGDLAGVAARLKGLTLLQRMLYPQTLPGDRGAARVTVTLASGETVTGRLASRDEFTLSLYDATGQYRAWQAGSVKAVIDNPRDAHAALLDRYTDKQIHDVLAYLQSTGSGAGTEAMAGSALEVAPKGLDPSVLLHPPPDSWPTFHGDYWVGATAC